MADGPGGLPVRIVDGSTFSGLPVAVVSAPIATGGFDTGGRFLGVRTAVGPPTTGTFAVGDWGFDSLGRLISCITAGTPGQWVFAGGTLVQSAITTAVQSMSSSTPTDITGCTVTFTATAQSFRLELSVIGISNDTGGDGWQVTLCDSTNAPYNVWRNPVVDTAGSGESATISSLITGLTYGTSYTFKGRMARITGGTVTLAVETPPLFASQLLAIAV